jgi:lipopolysaccharide transport system ATP-binding protein
MKSTMEVGNKRECNDKATAPGNGTVCLKSIKAFSENGQSDGVFDIRHPIAIEFEYWVCEDNAKLNPAFWLLNETETIVFISGGTHDPDWVERPRSPGLYKSRCWIPGNFLAEGTYTIRAIINTLSQDNQRPLVHVNEVNAITFQVYDPLEGGSARGFHRGAYYGVVRPILDWETELL